MTQFFADLPRENVDLPPGLNDGSPSPRYFGDLPKQDNAPVPDTPDMAAGSKSWLDYANGLTEKVATGATSGLAPRAAALFGSGFGLGSHIGLNDYSTILKGEQAKEAAFEKSNPTSAMVGEIAGGLIPGAVGGNFIMRAPSLAGRALRTAAISAPLGAVSSASKVTGDDKTFGDYANAALTGGATSAALGAGLSAAGSTIGATVGPWATEQAQRLLDRGVRLTPGETFGPNAKRMEDLLTSVPFSNRVLRNRQDEGISDFNRVALNTVTANINDGAGIRLHTPNHQLPADMDAGTGANEYIERVVQRAYGQVVPQLRARIDTPMRTSIANIRNNLPEDVHGRFDDELRRNLFNSADNTGGMMGRDVQNSLQGLRNRARALRSAAGSTAYDYDLASGLQDVRNLLQTNVEARSTPTVMRKFQNVNRAMAMLVRVQKAAKASINGDGVFTPAQLHAAVKSSEQGARQGAASIAGGRGLMQDLSSDAKSVMTRKISDSGTPERAALSGVMGAVAMGTGAKALAVPAALGMAYSRPAQATFRRLATAGTPTRRALARIINRSTSTLAPGVASADYQ